MGAKAIKLGFIFYTNGRKGHFITYTVYSIPPEMTRLVLIVIVFQTESFILYSQARTRIYTQNQRLNLSADRISVALNYNFSDAKKKKKDRKIWIKLAKQPHIQ